MMRAKPQTSGRATVSDHAAPASWCGRPDAAAVVVLAVLAVLAFGVSALLGHPVLPGDDLTQNFPLRVLTGHEIRAGQLPLYDPYIWSGAPLLADWNAGAAYPLTWLFAILPGAAAWSVNLIVTFEVAGLGMYWFLRALRLTSLASFLGALSFAFAGAMTAQVSHFGLVAGMSWVPVALLAVLRLSAGRGTASLPAWTAVLAAAIGLTILAGEPRAIDDAGVIVGIYAAWRVARLGRRCGPAAVSVLAGLALGTCLGAVQWLPGLAAIGTSQRAYHSMPLFGSGSLPVRWLLLTLVPDLLGGSGSLGQPAFATSYNLTEVTSYVGILPLVAAFALLGRLRLRGRPPEWIIWHGIALVGIVLALGDNTPFRGLLFHLPLFGSQRLQSRNVLVLDLALAVLLAYWADQPFGEARLVRYRLPGSRGSWRVPVETVLGVLPALAATTVVTIAFMSGTGLLKWLGVSAGRSARIAARLEPWLLPYAVLGFCATVLVIFGRRLAPKLRGRLLAAFVAVDIVGYTILTVVAVLPGATANASTAVLAAGGAARPAAGAGTAAGGTAAGAAAAAAPRPAAGGTAAGGTARPSARDTSTTSSPRPIAALGFRGRFAIYDPALLDPGELAVLGPPDLNTLSGIPSIQGYSSIVDRAYAAATGSHPPVGAGQDRLSPQAVGDGTLDQLDTAILLTPPAYLITAAHGGQAAPPGSRDAGSRDLSPHQHATWYLGTRLEVTGVTVPDPHARQDAAAGTELGLTAPDGSTRWFRPTAASASALTVSLPRAVAATTVRGRAGGAPCRLGAPSVSTSDGRAFVADGQLQNALVPPRWSLRGFDGSFAIFADTFARAPVSITALRDRSANGAWIRAMSGDATGPASATVFSSHGARVVRSVAAIPGWSATWQPRRGRPVTLAVRRDGLIQSVLVPPGLGVLSWHYTPPGFAAGLALSAAAALLIALLFAAGFVQRRARAGTGCPLAHRGGAPVDNVYLAIYYLVVKIIDHWR